jgi:hypothetical protein
MQLREQRQIQGFFASLRMTTENKQRQDKQRQKNSLLGGYDEVEGDGLG